MSYFNAQEKKITALKQRIAMERVICGQQARALVPGGVRSGSRTVVSVAQKAMPFLKPIAFMMARRLIFKLGTNSKFLKVAGLGALAFGAWRFFDGGEDSGEAALED